MTVSTTTSKIGYSGNGVTTAFTVPFKFLADTDLAVVLTNTSDVDTTQTLTTHYAVSGAGADTGGTVTMVTAPASGERLTIYRNMSITQSTDYISGDSFPAETHETALDKLTMISQQLETIQNRTIRGPETATLTDYELDVDPADYPLYYVRVKAAGAGFELAEPSSATVAVDNAANVAYDPLGTGVVQSTVQAKLREMAVSVADYGVTADYNFTTGVGTDRTSAIQSCVTQNAVTYIPDGGTLGYLIEGQIVVPYGHVIITNYSFYVGSTFLDPSVASTSSPGGVTFVLTGTTSSPFVLRTNAAVSGIHFFYPNQKWDITLLTDSFVTYPATFQIGDATDSGPFNCNISHCSFLGGTDFVKQYDGTVPIKSVVIDHCTGWLLNGTFLTMYNTTDVSYVNNIHFNPNFVVWYAVQKGADAIKFRTKAITQGTKMFHLGRVDEIYISDSFVYGVDTFMDYNNNMYTGDANEGFGAKINNVSVDACHQAFKIQRSSGGFGLMISNGFYTPLVRPNGVAGDSATQCFMNLTSGIYESRIKVNNVRVFSGVVNEFDTGYVGTHDHAFVSAAALASTNHVQCTNTSFSNHNTAVKDANSENVVHLGNHVDKDVYMGGESRKLIGPFTYTNLQNSNTGEFMYIATTNSTGVEGQLETGVPLMRKGRISGLMIASDAALTAGTATIKPWIDSTESTTLSLELASTEQRDHVTQNSSNDQYAEGSILRLRISTDATFAPINSDLVAWVEITDQD